MHDWVTTQGRTPYSCVMTIRLQLFNILVYFVISLFPGHTMGLALFYVVIAFSNYITVVLIPLTYKSVGTGEALGQSHQHSGKGAEHLIKIQWRRKYEWEINGFWC